MALAAIYQSVPEDVLLTLADKDTAKAAWEMIKMMNLGVERVKEARIQTLKSDFEMNGKEAVSMLMLNELNFIPSKEGCQHDDSSIWYLDNGVSNHMTGKKENFPRTESILPNSHAETSWGELEPSQTESRMQQPAPTSPTCFQRMQHLLQPADPAARREEGDPADGVPCTERADPREVQGRVDKPAHADPHETAADPHETAAQREASFGRADQPPAAVPRSLSNSRSGGAHRAAVPRPGDPASSLSSACSADMVQRGSEMVQTSVPCTGAHTDPDPRLVQRAAGSIKEISLMDDTPMTEEDGNPEQDPEGEEDPEEDPEEYEGVEDESSDTDMAQHPCSLVPVVLHSAGSEYADSDAVQDPLRAEYEKIRKEIDHAAKNHEDMKSCLRSDCDKEIEVAIARIRDKYEVKLREIEGDYLQERNALDEIRDAVLLHKILADAFRFKSVDHEDRESEVVDFWMPRVGDRWDFDEEGGERPPRIKLRKLAADSCKLTGEYVGNKPA